VDTKCAMHLELFVLLNGYKDFNPFYSFITTNGTSLSVHIVNSYRTSLALQVRGLWYQATNLHAAEES